MNFVRSRLSTSNLFGQRFRGMCNKVQETKAQSTPPAPAQESRPLFKVPGFKPSNMDKKMLVWTGRFKSQEQIPETVSFETIDLAKSKMRIKVAYVMMALTIVGSVIMVILGKRAAARNETLTSYNLQKKAKLREERERERERENARADAVPQKTQ